MAVLVVSNRVTCFIDVLQSGAGEFNPTMPEQAPCQLCAVLSAAASNPAAS
ncbi:hypothetical protein [Bradyrhizobium sp. WD16]|uniref:hypothetical protein n=1 Tax=Bradyrhizobium sp. WD16 TaxID=1521768 RepID=UPI0020A55803|nr:hypothetical protein [Bradyrhizobium sp. WD16]